MKQASVKTSRRSRKGAGAQGAETGANLLPQEGSAPAKDQLAMGGAYEGAKRFTQELMNWHVRNGSADMDLLPEKNMIDAGRKTRSETMLTLITVSRSIRIPLLVQNSASTPIPISTI